MQLRNLRSEDLPEIRAIEELNFDPAEKIEDPIFDYYAQELASTCLVVESNHQVAGYLIAVPSDKDRVDDAIFLDPASLKGQDRYLSIASLSIAEEFKGQGLGTLLLAGLKEVALAQEFEGIALTCHDYLLSFYERHGFEDQGLSESSFGGQEWYDMYWEAKPLL